MLDRRQFCSALVSTAALAGAPAAWAQGEGPIHLLVGFPAGGGSDAIARLLAAGIHVTDSNAAFFDADNDFRGCIAGIHEVLRRQGLMAGRWCLDPEEDVSPGQLAEIDRVYAAYPELNDDAFVARHLAEWLPGMENPR